MDKELTTLEESIKKITEYNKTAMESLANSFNSVNMQFTQKLLENNLKIAEAITKGTHISIPQFSIPQINVPQINVPQINIPKISIPKLEVNIIDVNTENFYPNTDYSERNSNFIKELIEFEDKIKETGYTILQFGFIDKYITVHNFSRNLEVETIIENELMKLIKDHGYDFKVSFTALK